MKNVIKILSSVLMVIVFISCQKENGNTRLQVFLTDAPADYEEVLVDIVDVRVNVAGDGEAESWRSLQDINTGIYNLLDFTNGIDTLLGEIELPAGQISQIRLVLGSDNKVKVNGVYHDLSTPSAMQSGLKLNLHMNMEAGITYKLWLDFDAGQSIVERGNGTYLLKPVIRTMSQAVAGAIKGKIVPSEALPYVMAISADEDTIGTYADETGFFMLKGLDAGTYTVAIEPVEGYVKKELMGVAVVVGVVTNLEAITIDQE
jgi:hypothetical protein